MSDTTPTAGQALVHSWWHALLLRAYRHERAEMAADIDAALAQARREGAEAMRARIVDITRERAKAMASVRRSALSLMADLVEVLDAPLPPDLARKLAVAPRPPAAWTAEQVVELARAHGFPVGGRANYVLTPAEVATLLADVGQPPDLARELAEARAALAECVRVMVQSDAEHDEGIGDDEWQAAIAAGRAALGEGDAS